VRRVWSKSVREIGLTADVPGSKPVELGSEALNEESSRVGKARAAGESFDPRRIELFEKLHDALRKFPPEPVRPWRPLGNAAVNQTFFEAYFSNFIEGTEFAVEEAEAIVFRGEIPADRPADAHDVIGTFKLVSNAAEMRRLPESAEDFIEPVTRARQMHVELRVRPAAAG
jgi:hypothetical protein